MKQNIFGTKNRWKNWGSNYPFIIFPVLGIILCLGGPISTFIGLHLIEWSILAIIVIGVILSFFWMIRSLNHPNKTIKNTTKGGLVVILIILLIIADHWIMS